MKVTLAQMNTVVGDVPGNLEKALRIIQGDSGASDLILFPELLTVGYPPRDLLFRQDLIDLNLRARDMLVEATKGIGSTVVFGYVEPNYGEGRPLFNSACAAQGGQIVNIRRKMLLPTYDVFEEEIYFERGDGKDIQTYEVAGRKVATIICEECWNDPKYWKKRRYTQDPLALAAQSGAEELAIINASPYRRGVIQLRRDMIEQSSKALGIPVHYVNQVGYNDDVGFDGSSFATNGDGEIIVSAPSFSEEIVSYDTAVRRPEPVVELPWQEEVLLAMKLGITDYFGKQNITGPAIIGLSGGIDSALVAYLAAWALGKDRVVTIGMPSEFSSDHSVTDAEKLAKRLGFRFALAPIRGIHDSVRETTTETFGQLHGGADEPLFGLPLAKAEDTGVTDENFQARIRGLLLMGVANRYSGLVLSTSNKSESAVGYTTLYGDMCGGLAVISDIPKTWVYAICRYINESFRSEIIPRHTIEKPPSAELRKDQVDQDSLPPYELLDAVMGMYVDDAKSPEQIKAKLATEEAQVEYLRAHGRMIEADIDKVCRLICNAQFKRVQAPTGIKVTAKLFKMGYRMPIVHKLRP